MQATTPIKIFISNHDDSLHTERQWIQRAIETIATPTQDLAASQLYLGLFGQHIPSETLQEYASAHDAKKDCLLFAKNTLPQESTQYLAHPYSRYENLTDLSRQVIHKVHMLYPVRDWQPPALPLRRDPFAGREDTLKHVMGMLNSSQPIVIRGAAGGGKTAFALELAYRLKTRGASVFWLEKVRNLNQATLRQLAAAHPSGRQHTHNIRPAEVRGWLGESPTPCIVIVDDVEHVDHLQALHGVLPHNIALIAITSNTSPKESGGNYFDLPSLDENDGIAFFTQYLNLPEQLAEDALHPLRQVIELLNGHALSLRLAIDWMRRAGGWQSALMLVKRLADHPQPFANLAVTRHSTTEQVLSLLYHGFSDAQKVMFRTAGIFEADTAFPIEALDHLIQPHQTSPISLLAPTLDTCRVHRILHRYARALLEQHHQLNQTQIALMDYAENHPLNLIQRQHIFTMIRTEYPERLATYTLTVGNWLQDNGDTDVLQTWLKETLTALPKNGLHAQTLRALGDLAARLPDTTTAQAYYERALLVYYEQKSLSGQANTLKAMGDLRAQEGHHQEAQEYYDRTLLLYAQIDFQLGRANTLKALGDLSLEKSEYVVARDYYNRAVAVSEQIDFQLGQAHSLNALGKLNLRERDWVNARLSFEHAMAIYAELSFFSQQADVLQALGKLSLETHQTDTALEQYENALHLFKRIKNYHGVGKSYQLIGELHRQEEAYTLAIEAYQNAHQAFTTAQDYVLAAQQAVHIAECEMALQDAEKALQALLAAMRIFYEHHAKDDIQYTRQVLKELARNVGRNFIHLWTKTTGQQTVPEWLNLAPATNLPQTLVYAVRDLILSTDPDIAKRIIEKHDELLLQDEADEVFAQMLRQYAGQNDQTRHIDRYRNLLQRCRQIGIENAFLEFNAPPDGSQASEALRLRRALDDYDYALSRLEGIPSVYASVQLNRATTLRELAALPRQDRLYCLEQALEAYADALQHQINAPLNYAETQIARASVFHELAELPDVNQQQYWRKALDAYTDALSRQHDLPTAYAKTQIARAGTLHQLAMLPQEDTSICMVEALAAYDEALTILYENDPIMYAMTQSERARVLYEVAGLPGEDFAGRMEQALSAYDEALEYLRDEDSLAYGKTQSYRVRLLRDMAGLPNQERTARLYQALAACNEALRYLVDAPTEYTDLQINRAHLMREIAGLSGEHRIARMREALAIYNEVLELLDSDPKNYAAVQNSRAALLREMSSISGEKKSKRLRQSMEAAADAIIILERVDPKGSALNNAKRMMKYTRKAILKTEDETTFNIWWQQVVGTPHPDWLT